MYNHRITAYLLFTTTFYITSLFSTLVAWVVLSTYLSSAPKSSKTIKPDSDTTPSSTEHLSDTLRTLPTSSRQQPLHYSPRLKGEEIKKEDEEEIARTTYLQPLAGTEADDEDDEQFEEDAGMSFRDSGIGTSLDDGERRDGAQRRRRGPFVGLGRSP